MKFIKFNDDMYINAVIVQGIVIKEIDGAFWVQAGVASPYPINLAHFETRDEARQEYRLFDACRLNLIRYR